MQLSRKYWVEEPEFVTEALLLFLENKLDDLSVTGSISPTETLYSVRVKFCKLNLVNKKGKFIVLLS